jgi:hypothetical protein
MNCKGMNHHWMNRLQMNCNGGTVVASSSDITTIHVKEKTRYDVSKES